MKVAVLDAKHEVVDIINVNDSLIPESMSDEEWISGMLEAKGYDMDSCSFMCCSNNLSIRELTLYTEEEHNRREKEREGRRKDILANGKLPKNWN